ncbi:hypothetical protein GJV85_06480 [Sulfurimonas aquatica]|uniref:Uncharacterized protein n=1 Tax=Sulfurimonas aquatica TaxID=2672570 RepID=A0A975GCX7_9BACT|nr:hypothetical protein [Sulfurimonas aquatica]QSZ41768.1 hypothetical protein GJV85_06480 [Sulfurimonas aquatica]
MSPKFNVSITEFQKINKIENAWGADDYIALLDSMDLGDDELSSMNEADLKEMCKMSLADFEPEEAANYVITYLMQDELTEGKLEQISNEMMDDKLWEQFADLSFHERFFNSYELLRESFNGRFPKPTGVKMAIKISSKNKESFNVFANSLKPAIVRLLAAGVDEHAIFNRLYDEKIASNNFSEAQSILWKIKEMSKSDLEVTYEIISSEFWLGDLENREPYEAQTHADKMEDEE